MAGMLFPLLAACGFLTELYDPYTTDGADSAGYAEDGCTDAPSVALLHGWWWSDMPGETMEDGDPLRILTGPSGGWTVTFALRAQHTTEVVTLHASLSEPESDYFAEVDYRIQLFPEEEGCGLTTDGDLYVFLSNLDDRTPPEVLGCADLTLSLTLTDEDGVVLEDSHRLIGECDEYAEDTCGC